MRRTNTATPAKLLRLLLALALAALLSPGLTAGAGTLANPTTAYADEAAEDTAASGNDAAAAAGTDAAGNATAGEYESLDPDALSDEELAEMGLTREDIDGTGTSTEVEEPQPTAEESAFMEKLAALDGISNVEFNNMGYVAASIEQPLDWATDTGKTFQQQFMVKFGGYDVPTCYTVGGYTLLGSMGADTVIPQGYTFNNVCIEYRFFGGSEPEGLDYNSADLWQYLTIENAAEDFHALITKLSTIFPGKRMMTGASKGGFTTNVQAYKHPEDADLFLPFCAPLCNSTADTRMYDFLNNSVGDDVLGESDAKELRDLVTDFQLECIRYKDDLKARYLKLAFEAVPEGEDGYRPVLLEDEGGKLYDFAVADMQGAVWMLQGGYYEFSTLDGLKSTLSSVVDMPASTAEEVEKKKDAVLETLSSISSPSSYSCSHNGNPMLYPYIIQSAMQMGNYAEDLTPLRNRIAEEQAKDPSFPSLSISKDEETNLMTIAYLTDEQLEMASKFSLVHDELVEWQNTTTANVVMVFGAVDPWRAVAIPECSNPNVKRIMVKSGPNFPMMGHSMDVTSFDSESQAAIYAAIEPLFSEDSAGSEAAAASSGAASAVGAVSPVPMGLGIAAVGIVAACAIGAGLSRKKK